MQKINYQKQMEDYIAKAECRYALALHSCCGPCSTYCLECLVPHFDVTVFFYNPNIHPEAEYLHRFTEQKRLCETMGVKLVECAYDADSYFAYVKGLEDEPEGGARCTKCFQMRLSHTAELAKEAGIDVLATTLTVSPHKNAHLINALGTQIAAEHDLAWLPSDFKKKNGYFRSVELSKEYELYRQNYCGCVFSDWTRTQRETEE